MGNMSLDTGKKVVGAGFFDAQAGAPAWFWQKGFLAANVRNAAGNYTLNLERGGLGNGAFTPFVCGAETEAAQRSTRFGVTRTNATQIVVTTMQETGAGGGAASAAADKDFWIVIFKKFAG